MTNDNRERSDDGTYTETVTPEDVLALFTDSEPRTASEVADELGIARRTALNKLDDLAEQDRIHRKKVGGRAVIWWVSDRGSDYLFEKRCHERSNSVRRAQRALRLTYEREKPPAVVAQFGWVSTRSGGLSAYQSVRPRKLIPNLGSPYGFLRARFKNRREYHRDREFLGGFCL